MPCVHGSLQRSKEDFGAPGTRVTWNWEPSDVVAGNRTRILCKSSKRSELLSQLSSPSPTFQKTFTTKLEPEYPQSTNLKSKSQKFKVFLIPIIPAFPSPPTHMRTCTLKTELKTLCILDKHSIIKPHPQLPHCLKNYCLRISYNET